MVLSLPVPSFARSSASPPRPADGTAPASRRHRGSASSSSSSSSRNAWKPPGLGGGASSSNSTSITLSEALRNNPFGSTSRSRSAQVSVEDVEEQRREQDELNTALETLARVFPDVRIEVFRELLVRFDGDSRLQVCVDQLLRHKEKWVSGRWNISSGQGKGEDGDADDRGDRLQAREDLDDEECLVPLEERFRSDEYKAMVRATLSKEYSSLSKSVVEAVLAEANFSYARARPTLRDLSRRTWRATFNSILPSFRKKKDREEHLLVAWQRGPDGESLPRLKETGCVELDAELYDALVAPVLQQRREEQELGDFRFAASINEKEARAADALYECECCFGDVTFEEIATCSANAHVICYRCIQRTTHEALFGQGWGKSVDLERSTLKCLAPLSIGSCDGCLHPLAVQRAILQETAGIETLRKFEDRLASEALLKSQLKLVRCPFCSYAEADPIYHSVPVGWRIRRDGDVVPTILMILLILDLVPILIIPFFVILILNPSSLTAVFKTAIRHLCLKIRPKRFTCANPTCKRISCMTCQKSWRDPHVCHEPLLTDLRATVEAARTAAVKRTCPRCGLSFVKSSGCNKLTCVCGYSMCYLCRKALGPPLQPARRNARPRDQDIFDGPADDLDNAIMNDISDDESEEPQGYKHFCEHFRINPGSRCTECSKCDLYQAEDEEAVARRAGEKAEREWHLRHGDVASSSEPAISLRNINQDLSAGTEGPISRRVSNTLWDLNFPAPGNTWTYWLADVWMDGRWKREGQVLVNWIVERTVVIEDV
ncbi:Histidinol-phosphatase [Penicillium atrosanguineum]|uniref:Histidinol-phosphatase n=1 Tax=Penicillium atrosanguineum TaxID=1132637 RepID=UPI0023A15D3F|nr:Histidinol-phosphatase [Penicillium atrosanguineum]KAJ5300757.1 Histidinol-phosphatase [Penicillium atrosanguineum]